MLSSVRYLIMAAVATVASVLLAGASNIPRHHTTQCQSSAYYRTHTALCDHLAKVISARRDRINDGVQRIPRGTYGSANIFNSTWHAMANVNPSYVVYDGRGNYLGADPDPNVRFQILRDVGRDSAN